MDDFLDDEEIHRLLGDADGCVELCTVEHELGNGSTQHLTTPTASHSPQCADLPYPTDEVDTESSTHTGRSDLSNDSETKHPRRLSNPDSLTSIPNEQSKVSNAAGLEMETLNVLVSGTTTPKSNTSVSSPILCTAPNVGIVGGSESIPQQANTTTDQIVSNIPVVKEILKGSSIVLKTNKRSLGRNKEYCGLRQARYMGKPRRKLSQPEIREFIEHIEKEFGIKQIHFFVQVTGGLGFQELTGDNLYNAMTTDIRNAKRSKSATGGTSNRSKCLASLIARKRSAFVERERDPLKKIIFEGILQNIGDSGVRSIISKKCKTELHDWGEKFWDYFMDDEFVLNRSYNSTCPCLSALMKTTRAQLFETRGDACKKIIFEGILNDIGLAAVDGTFNDEMKKDLQVWVENTWIFFFGNNKANKRTFSAMSNQTDNNDSGSNSSHSPDTSKKSRGSPKNDDDYPSDQSSSGNNQVSGGGGDRYAKHSAYFGYENVEYDRSDDDSSNADSLCVSNDGDDNDDDNEGSDDAIDLKCDHKNCTIAYNSSNFGSCQDEASMAVNDSNIRPTIDHTITNVDEVGMKMKEMASRLSQHGLAINYIDDETSTRMSINSMTNDDDYSTSSVGDDSVFHTDTYGFRYDTSSNFNESAYECTDTQQCTILKDGDINKLANVSMSVSDSDVLLGRGEHCARHIGNQMFLQRRNELYEQYIATSNSKVKRLIQAQLLISVYEKNGRFLTKCQCKDTNNNIISCWNIETDTQKLFRKAAQFLREGNRKEDFKMISVAIPKMLHLVSRSHTETSIGTIFDTTNGTQHIDGNITKFQEETRSLKM